MLEINFDKLETDDFIYFELQVDAEMDQSVTFTSIQTENSLATVEEQAIQFSKNYNLLYDESVGF